jgi:cell division protein FtsB
MKRFGRKNLFTDIIFSKITLLLLVIVIVYLATSTYERFNVERKMHDRRIEAEEKHKQLLERKQVLKDKVDYLKGESGIESEIRSHFDVAKDGEQVVIIVEDEAESQVNTDTNSSEAETKSPWYKFW